MKKSVEIRIHLLSAWGGPAMAMATVVGMLLMADFFPPPSPTLSANEVAELYRQNANGIRIGMILMMLGAALYLPFTAVTAYYIARVEGKIGVITLIQIMGGFSCALLFFYPCLWWLTAAFRLDRNADITLMLNDAASLQFVGALAPFLFMLASVAMAAFADDSEAPIFPRWVGYLNVWGIAAFLPDQLIFFFKAGPLAWDGFFGWWIPAVTFFGYVAVTFFTLVKAIRREAPQVYV